MGLPLIWEVCIDTFYTVGHHKMVSMDRENLPGVSMISFHSYGNHLETAMDM